MIRLASIMVVAAVCFAVCLTIPLGADADGIHFRSVGYVQNQGHCYQPAIVQQQYAVQKVVAQDIAVAPLIVTVPVDYRATPVQAYGYPYYYSVQDTFREDTRIRDIIREELKKFTLEAQQQRKETVPPPSHVPHPQQPANQQTGEPEVKKVTIDTTTPMELRDKIIAAFTAQPSNCYKCHGQGGRASKGLVLLTEYNGKLELVTLDNKMRSLVYVMSEAGMMPPAARDDASKAMPAQYHADLLKWASQP